MDPLPEVTLNGRGRIRMEGNSPRGDAPAAHPLTAFEGRSFHTQRLANAGPGPNLVNPNRQEFVDSEPRVEPQKDERLVAQGEEGQDRAEANFLGVGEGRASGHFPKIAGPIRLD